MVIFRWNVSGDHLLLDILWNAVGIDWTFNNNNNNKKISVYFLNLFCNFTSYLFNWFCFYLWVLSVFQAEKIPNDSGQVDEAKIPISDSMIELPSPDQVIKDK